MQRMTELRCKDDINAGCWFVCSELRFKMGRKFKLIIYI